jgi:predicted 3-demethylubiquinone-9 3-methyltransferase (glyoxalase superfamily)
MPYGDRRCMVKDKWGNTWQIATHMGGGDGPSPSMQPLANASR